MNNPLKGFPLGLAMQAIRRARMRSVTAIPPQYIACGHCTGTVRSHDGDCIILLLEEIEAAARVRQKKENSELVAVFIAAENEDM